MFRGKTKGGKVPKEKGTKVNAELPWKGGEKKIFTQAR